jgi:hypothetical protein
MPNLRWERGIKVRGFIWKKWGDFEEKTKKILILGKI